MPSDIVRESLSDHRRRRCHRHHHRADGRFLTLLMVLLWDRSDPKSQSEVPVLEVHVSDAESAWRNLVLGVVDSLARIEANWCR